MFIVWTLLAAAALVGVDQLTKWWAVSALADGTVIPVWPGVFELRYTENRGMAFGLLQNQQWLFIVMTVLLILAVAIALYSGKLRRHPLVVIICVMIIGGGIGNLIDRCVNGFVVDFLYISLIDFPIFNVADICVTGAMVLTIVYLLFIEGRKPTEATDGKDHDHMVDGTDGAEAGQGAGGDPVGDPIDGAEMDGGGSGDPEWSSAE